MYPRQYSFDYQIRYHTTLWMLSESLYTKITTYRPTFSVSFPIATDLIIRKMFTSASISLFLLVSFLGGAESHGYLKTPRYERRFSNFASNYRF